MKRFIKSLLVVSIAFIMAFSFVSCFEMDDDSEKESTSKESVLDEESEEQESGVKTPSQAKDRLKNKGYSVTSYSGRILDALKNQFVGITGGFSGNKAEEDVTVYIFDTQENALVASKSIAGFKMYTYQTVVIFGTEKGVEDAKKAFNF